MKDMKSYSHKAKGAAKHGFKEKNKKGKSRKEDARKMYLMKRSEMAAEKSKRKA